MGEYTSIRVTVEVGELLRARAKVEGCSLGELVSRLVVLPWPAAGGVPKGDAEVAVGAEPLTALSQVTGPSAAASRPVTRTLRYDRKGPSVKGVGVPPVRDPFAEDEEGPDGR